MVASSRASYGVYSNYPDRSYYSYVYPYSKPAVRYTTSYPDEGKVYITDKYGQTIRVANEGTYQRYQYARGFYNNPPNPIF